MTIWILVSVYNPTKKASTGIKVSLSIHHLLLHINCPAINHKCTLAGRKKISGAPTSGRIRLIVCLLVDALNWVTLRRRNGK